MTNLKNHIDPAQYHAKRAVKKTELTLEKAREIANAMGVQLFERKNSSSAKYDAQLNLAGKTHYADDGALKFFFSRINSTRTTDHGLIFILIESMARDHRNRTRGFRFAAFDLFGTQLNRRMEPADMPASSAAAEKAMWDWANGFDALAHYKAALYTRAAAQLDVSRRLQAQANSIKI